jgi:two-component system, NtrC family, response regulator HydG
MRHIHQGVLIYERDDRFALLQSVLEGLSVGTRRARTCRQAGTLLSETPAPLVAVTDCVLGDGNWLDVLDLAARAREKVNVIVVSPFADVGLYIDVMDHGAFDFITDSFTVPEIVHVVSSAISNAVFARERTTKLSAPSRQTPHPPQPTHP